jgi:hypothetical protein
LVFVSLFFGHFLAKLESQGEIDSNDAFMKRTFVRERFRELVGTTLATLPTLCYQLYVNGTMTPDMVDEAFLVQFMEEQRLQVDRVLEEAPGEMITTTTTDLRDFMIDCGRVVFDVITSIEKTWYESLDVDTSAEGLSFNWIQCINDSIVEKDLIFPGKAQIEAYRPAAQADFYSQTWRERQLSFVGEESIVTGFLQDFENSVNDATSGDKCDVNSMSGAWFWFTVMTTVGKFEARSSLSPEYRRNLYLYEYFNSTALLLLNE